MNNFLDKDPLVNKLVNKIDESKGVLQTQWKNNDPSVTRHIIIDNFISEELCHTIFKDYVSLKQNFIVGKYLLKQNKKTLNNLDYVSLQTKNLYSALHSREFVSAIERVVETAPCVASCVSKRCNDCYSFKIRCRTVTVRTAQSSMQQEQRK